MPLSGSTAYILYSSVTPLVRSMLNDAPANVFTDTVLIPYMQSSYRRVQRKLAIAGAPLFITDDVELVISAVPYAQQGPGTQVVLNDASAPPNQLPSNLLQPLKISERPNLSTTNFAKMTDRTMTDGLPLRTQGATLGDWEWRTDGIYFVGATQDTQIVLRYTASLPDLTGPTSYIMIRFSQEAIAYGAAALAGAARGAPLAQQYADEQDQADEDLIAYYVRQQQHSGARRRRPFGARGGGYSASRWGRGGDGW
jgi:hypothetical protein